jgi:hypothetical protein
MSDNEEHILAVEQYFDVRLDDLDLNDPYDRWLYNSMWRIQCDYDNGFRDIGYYASLYGF